MANGNNTSRFPWCERCVAIIPCLNEGQTIGAVVMEAKRFVNTILVIDDGSFDGTAEEAQRAGALVIRHAMRQGKGSALSSGLHRARELGFQWAVLLDGDGQHLPGEMPVLFGYAEEHDVAMVIGNRMAGMGEMPWLRRQVNRWMSRRISKMAGVFLPDTQCGFRLVCLEAFAAVRLSAREYEIESDLTLQFIRQGFRVGSAPVTAVYRRERSKIRPVRDTWRWFLWWRENAGKTRQLGEERNGNDGKKNNRTDRSDTRTGTGDG